jgi:hypothetical protein
MSHRYVYKCGPAQHALKTHSLEDRVYFTVRDIFMNAESPDLCIECNYFNAQLTQGVSYEDRPADMTFSYTNDLQDKAFVQELLKWLDGIRPKRDFFFTDSTLEKANDYISLDQWSEDFLFLKLSLSARLLELLALTSADAASPT